MKKTESQKKMFEKYLYIISRNGRLEKNSLKKKKKQKTKKKKVNWTVYG